MSRSRARMVGIRTAVGLVALLGALLVAAPAAGSPAAGAEANQGVAAGTGDAGIMATCYTGRTRSFFLYSGGYTPAPPNYVTTSSYCRDINLRNTGEVGYWACVEFLKVGYCNYDTWMPPYSGWKVIASNVADNTRFRLYIYSGQSALVYGTAAY